MKHVQLFEQFLNEKISKSDLKKIESYLNKQDEDTLFAFAEDAYSESDDDELADEWNDVKDDLSIDELKDYIIDHIKRFELDFEEFKDAMSIYESKFLNEAKYSTSDMKKLKAFAKDVADEIYDEYEEDFNSGDLDEEEYNTEGMLDYLIDWASGDPVSKVIKDFNWKSLQSELGLR